MEEKGGDDSSGYTFEELGELYFQKGDSDNAKQYFAKAYEVLSQDKWLMKNEKQRIDRILDLSK